MSSMTDLIFLLLLFFVMASTMSSPNDIKVNLPQASSKTTTRDVVAKVTIDDKGQYFVAIGDEKPKMIEAEELEARLCQVQRNDSSMCIALHADQEIAYKEVVYVLDIANQHHMKMVIATQR